MATRKKRPRSRSEREQGRSPPLTASGKTGSDLALDVVVTPSHRSPADFAETLGFPGEPPFTRGARATMYRGRLWTMRQYAGFGTAKETNRRFRYLLEHGNEGLSVAFDLPTQMGYDSDAPLARGEVGRVGVAISTIEDMGRLFDGLPLDRVSTSMTINATAPILLALYIAVAPQISFFFNAHIDLLEEVAKFRAARRLWGTIMRDRFHAKQAESMALRFHAQTAGVTLTAQQPEINAVRVAVQALAAVLGGAQSLHTNSMDEALSLPSEKAVRLALRTQQILAHESGVANTVDPAGGSAVIESLTDRLEAEAATLIRGVDRHGGMRKGIESGWVQLQVADSAYRYQVELERGERTVVGVNGFLEEGPRIPIPKTNPKLAAERTRTLRQFRGGRDPKAAKRHLGRLEDVARREENVMPALIEAVKTKATLGEISDVLRTVFGTYRPRQEV